MVVRLALELPGYLLSEVDYGERGVLAAASLQPDCILLDYHLPDLNGFEASCRNLVRNAHPAEDWFGSTVAAL